MEKGIRGYSFDRAKTGRREEIGPKLGDERTEGDDEFLEGGQRKEENRRRKRYFKKMLKRC